MAERNRNTLKGYFLTGGYPTEQQFWDLIDSTFSLLEDTITMANINGLQTALNSKADVASINSMMAQLAALGGTTSQSFNADGSFQIPDGQLIKSIAVIPTAAINFSIGYTNNGQEILPASPLVANKGNIFTLDIYANGPTTIYLNGITAPVVIKFYLIGGSVSLALNADGNYVIPDGTLVRNIVVIPTAAENFSIGYTNNGREVLNTTPLVAGKANTFTVDLYANGATTIYLNGITSPTQIKFYNA